MEKRELKVLDVLTPGGQVKGPVRDALREEVANKYLADFTKENDGSYTVALIQNTDGTVVRARIALTISTKDTFEKGTKKAKETASVVLPDIFG